MFNYYILLAIGETAESADICHTTICSLDGKEIIDSEQDVSSFMIEDVRTKVFS